MYLPFLSFSCFILLSVTARHNYVKCVAGESLFISLEGIDLADAVLSFSGLAANVTLVRWMDGELDVKIRDRKNGWIKMSTGMGVWIFKDAKIGGYSCLYTLYWNIINVDI